GRNTGTFQRSGEQARAESLAERSDTVNQLRSRRNVPLYWHLMEQIAAERIKFVADAIAIFGVERQFAQGILMQAEDGFSLSASALVFAMCEILRDRQKAIGDALHRGDHHHDLR